MTYFFSFESFERISESFESPFEGFERKKDISESSSFHSPYCLRLKGIVGPMVLGIAAAKFFADFKVG